MTEAATLLDVNVLVSLAWPNHVHHEAAHAWLGGGRPWATCPVTQAGFVRVSSNRAVIPGARTPLEALALLRRMTDRPSHEFWADDADLTRPLVVRESALVGHRQVGDAHLLTLALQRGGRLATFDQGIRSLAPPGREDVVELLGR